MCSGKKSIFLRFGGPRVGIEYIDIKKKKKVFTELYMIVHCTRRDIKLFKRIKKNTQRLSFFNIIFRTSMYPTSPSYTQQQTLKRPPRQINPACPLPFALVAARHTRPVHTACKFAARFIPATRGPRNKTE